MISLNLRTGELQRVATQLEDAIDAVELQHYSEDDRCRIAAALVVAVRLELARLRVLGDVATDANSA